MVKKFVLFKNHTRLSGKISNFVENAIEKIPLTQLWPQ